MGTYEEDLVALRAEGVAELQRELAQAAARQDPLRHQQQYFLLQLIEARQIKKLSQAALAKQLGMHRSGLARIESGRGNPSLRTLLKIADALDVHLVLE